MMYIDRRQSKFERHTKFLNTSCPRLATQFLEASSPSVFCIKERDKLPWPL